MPEIKQGGDEPWWAHLIGATVLIGVAFWMYHDLTAFEVSGGERTMPWLLILLYKVLGKWGIVGFLGVAGIGMTFHGLNQLRVTLAGPPPRPKKKSLDQDE
jgi:hypothetical protein